jgi:hypothetical protein
MRLIKLQCSECENVAKKSCIFIILEKKMEVIRRMGDGQTYPDVCRSMKLPPSTVNTIIKTLEKIKRSAQHAMTVRCK